MSTSGAKIAYLVSEYPARSHTFIRREREALVARGLDIDILAIRRCPEEELRSDAERREWERTWSILPIGVLPLLGIVVTRFLRSPVRFFSTLSFALRNRLPGMGYGLWSLFYFIESLVVSRHLEKMDARHLHVHFAIASAHIGILCHRMTGIPWSLTLHGACDFEYPAGPLLGKKLQTAEFAVCVSKYGRSQAMRATGPEHWSKLELVRCGVERGQFIDVDALAEDKDSLELYAVGRLSAEKGQLVLLDAFAEVLQSLPEARLSFIGYGPDEALLKARSAELGIAGRITWLGPETESGVIEQLRANAQVLVVPSFMEGLPMVLMEAMANGVCVVAPRLAGIPELVDHGNNGLLYHPADASDMAEKICRLLSDRELRLRLKQAAWQTVSEEFCVDTSVAPLEARFRALGA